MSAKARCHTCEHSRGPRELGVNRTAGPSGKRKEGLQKKASCSCACHGSPKVNQGVGL